MSARIRLAGLIGLIAAIALGMTAFRSGAPWLRAILALCALGMLGYGIVGSLLGRGERRHFWIGFVTFGALMAWWSSPVDLVDHPGEKTNDHYETGFYVQIAALVDQLSLPGYPPELPVDLRMRENLKNSVQSFERDPTKSYDSPEYIGMMRQALVYYAEVDKRYERIEVIRWSLVMLAGVIGGWVAATRFGSGEQGTRT